MSQNYLITPAYLDLLKAVGESPRRGNMEIVTDKFSRSRRLTCLESVPSSL